MNGIVVFILLLLFVYISNKHVLHQKKGRKDPLKSKTLDGGGHLKTRAMEYRDMVNDPHSYFMYKNLVPVDAHHRQGGIFSATNVLKRQSTYLTLHDQESSKTKATTPPSVALFAAPILCFSKILDTLGITQQDFLDEDQPDGLVLFHVMVQKNYVPDTLHCNTIYDLLKKLLQQIESALTSDGACLEETQRNILESLKKVKAPNPSYLIIPVSEETFRNFYHPLTRALRDAGFLKVSFDCVDTPAVITIENSCWKFKNKDCCSSRQILSNGCKSMGDPNKTVFFKKILDIKK
jgi:hypothetical protein